MLEWQTSSYAERRPRLERSIFIRKVEETKTEESFLRIAFGLKDSLVPFLWNTVVDFSFQRKTKIQSELRFSLPSRSTRQPRCLDVGLACARHCPISANLKLALISTHICLTCYNSCVPNSLNFLFLYFEIP